MAKSLGILTGGGDCPGLNAVIRAVVRRADSAGWDVVAVREGWRGLVEPIFEDLGPLQVSGILPRGGTIIGTSRTNPFKVEGAVERVVQNFSDRGLDALVAIGGEDTLGVAARLYDERQFPVVGVPKTIDNDLSGTDYTFGFDTAVFIATEAIDRLHTTAESHNRVMVVEVMGRQTGWIAVMSGIAGGADVILVPEVPVDFDEVARDDSRRVERVRAAHPSRTSSFTIEVSASGVSSSSSSCTWRTSRALLPSARSLLSIATIATLMMSAFEPCITKLTATRSPNPRVARFRTRNSGTGRRRPSRLVT